VVGDALRGLFESRGAEILLEPTEFAAALSDWVSPEEADAGELNLLIDAVRFGAPQQLQRLVSAGADGTDAILASARYLAQNRGGGAEMACAWAVASLGCALDLVSPQHAGFFPRPAGGSTASMPTTSPTMTTPVAAPTPLEDTVMKAVHVPPIPPVPPGPQSAPPPEPPIADRRPAATVAVVVLAALLAGALGVVAVWALNGDDADRGTDTTSSSDDGPASAPSGPATVTATATATATESVTIDSDESDADDVNGLHRGPLAEQEIVVSTSSESFSQLLIVDTETGEIHELTSGPSDELPSISPDRATVIYLQRTDVSGRRPQVLDLATGTSYDLLGAGSACSYGNRPGFSPDGTMVALVCTDARRTPTGLYVLDLRGNLIDALELGRAGLWGAPTWTSNDEIVYTTIGGADDPERLWTVRLGGSPQLLTDGADGFDSHPDYDPVTDRLLFLRSVGDDAHDRATRGDEIGGLWYLEDGSAYPAGGPDGVGHPALSPDGRSVAFSLVVDGATVLAVAPLDDLNDVRVFDVPISLPLAAPAWGSR